MATYRLVQVDKQIESDRFCWCFNLLVDGVIVQHSETSIVDGEEVTATVDKVFMYIQKDSPVLNSSVYQGWAEHVISVEKNIQISAAEEDMDDVPDFEVVE